MLVRCIKMDGFMSHTDTRVEFPSSGVVLVTGPNGSGKSSLVEAVSTAAFGKTLRGTPPWSGKGFVSLITNDHDITRTHTKGGTNRLKWEPIDGDDPVAFESTTKAQDALEADIGTFDVWRRTSVFSSQDAAHFTMATDSQRKRLLEQLIGLDKFDPALVACRVDRKASETELSGATRLLEQLKSQLDTGEQRRVEAKQVLDTIPEPPDVSELQASLSKLNGLHKAATCDVRATEQVMRAFVQDGAKVEVNARTLKRQLDNLGEGNCDRCGRPITDKMRAPLLAAFAEAGEAAAAARTKAQAECATLADDLEELREEAEAIRAKGQALDHQLRDHATALRQRQVAEQAYSGACKALDGLQDRIDKGGSVIAEWVHTIAVLQAAEQVLGLKGVRAHVLGKALAGIERAANVWLSRIAGGDGEPMLLNLKPYSEKKSGGVSDSISLEVVGAGGGYGYKASSGGERRRIDVAILLALAEVAQAAHGQVGGTIWADECFDALDSVGVERVAAVLEELSQDRAIVVISHNPELQRVLNPVMCLRVDNGSIN